jgi:PPK2 family polyphosphate:nucleotide phosphotransferase
MDTQSHIFRKNHSLVDFSPSSTGEYTSKKNAKRDLELNVQLLAELQEKLYAADSHGVLVILQAMDAAGKDGIIKHVMSAVNPQGCQVRSFKSPSAEELDHDYMWRCFKHLPERGNIAIFNRSYYEEVLIVKVHPKFLKNQKLPLDNINTEEFWQQRYRQMNNFEQYLEENGFKVVKLFLHLSPQEQKRRFMRRINMPDKHWKFSVHDIEERQHWDKYMQAYEQMLQHTSTQTSPWHIVPADRKWYARLLASRILVNCLENLHLSYPVVAENTKTLLHEAKERLENE